MLLRTLLPVSSLALQLSLVQAGGWEHCGPYLWATTVKVYIEETGADPKSTCEVRGDVWLGDATVQINANPPKFSKFESPGIKVAEVSTTSRDLPVTKYEVKMFEEGNWFQENRYLMNMTEEVFHFSASMPRKCYWKTGEQLYGYKAKAQWCAERRGQLCVCYGDGKRCWG